MGGGEGSSGKGHEKKTKGAKTGGKFFVRHYFQ